MLQRLILCLLAALPVAAQDKPDFSGRWILAATEQTPDDVPRAMTVRQILARTNVRGEPVTPFVKEISVAREFASERRDEIHTVGISGGFVSGVVGASGPAAPRGYFAVRWDGPALVFESGTYTGNVRETGVWLERREAWAFDLDGRLRITMSSRSSTAATDSIRTLIYQRPPAAARLPVVTPFFVTEAVAHGPAFFVECVNTTTSPISKRPPPSG